MKTDSWEQVDQFWAHELGVDSSLRGTSRIHCSPQRLYAGVQLVADSERLVIASPPARIEHIQSAIGDSSPEEIFSVDWLQRVLAGAFEKILGPAEVHYADETSFRSELRPSGRALTGADSEARRSLVDALDPTEVEDSGVSPDAFPAFGAFLEDTLCSVASYQVWEPSIAHITVATHPNYRRKGFARTAVQTLAKAALDRGMILQWRALSRNKNSLSLARDLGFQYYGSTLYVRLRSSD